MMRSQEREQIIKLRDGDPAAFRDLYRDTRKMLYQYALYKLGGNADAAEDLVSESYADAFDHAVSLTLNHNLKAWLLKIAHAKMVDYVRKQARRGVWLRRAGPLLAEAGKHGSPEELAVNEEDKRLIRAAFFRLADSDQELLRLKYHERLSVKDIAEQLGKTEKAVESLLYRAKREFGDLLARIGKERVYLPDRKEGTWESLFQIVF